MSSVPPIRREILVDADPALAFDVFTGAIGQWWPLDEKSVHGKGWPLVLDCYQEYVSVGRGGETWVALLHRPGPAAPRTGSLFEDPRFGQHVAFLNRMREAGYLVLAGPLGDAAGEGMTILRLPGPDRLDVATRLATQDDASVAGGFLAVTVRPWRVMMQGGVPGGTGA